MNFEEIEKNVIQWGKDRNLYKESSPFAQFDKLEEEANELFDSLLEHDLDQIKDGLGDMLVVMTHIAYFFDLDLTECFLYAYEQIKNRKGRIIDGIFVEETVPVCPDCGGTGKTSYYHDAGDHFSAGPAPGSGWRTKDCPACSKETQ